MGLSPRQVVRFMFGSVFVVFLIVLVGCMARSVVTPADRVKGGKFRYDCCNPGLDEATKWMCKDAQNTRSHTLVDQDGNKYEMIWSDCEVGKEPWRKWE